MAAMCCLKSTPPSFEINEGFVVTPSANPNSAASRISLRFAVSRKNFITKDSLPQKALRHLVNKSADAGYFNFHYITGLHARNARGRASRNQVAGIQCHDLRDVPYKKGDRECHVSRVAFLFHFTVKTGLDGGIFWIDVRFNPRADRTEGIERFAASELYVLALKIARRDVVHACVSENIAQWIFPAWNVARDASDHNTEFTFVLDLL